MSEKFESTSVSPAQTVKHEELIAAVQRLEKATISLEDFKNRVEHGEEAPALQLKEKETKIYSQMSLASAIPSCTDTVHSQVNIIDALIDELRELLF